MGDAVCLFDAHVVAKLEADIKAASKNVKLSCIPVSSVIYKCGWIFSSHPPFPGLFIAYA